MLIQTDVVGPSGTSLPDKGSMRSLLVSGRSLQEPVAWRGPIVMNTNEELQQALSELRAHVHL